MLWVLAAVWLSVALVWLLFCLALGHSRRPGDLGRLVVWSLAWPAWVPYVAFLWVLGFRGG